MKISRLFLKRNKVDIIFEEEENLVLRYDTVLKFGLKKNVDIDEKFRALLLSEDEKFQIKELSFRFLSNRMHSVAELKKKLLFKKFSAENIDLVLSDLSELNHLNDSKFAETFAHEKIQYKKFGLMKVKAELIRKGISKDIIESTLEKFTDQENFTANALQIAKKKLASSQYNKLDVKKKKEKLFRFLMTKGYSPETIKNVLKNIHLGNEITDEFD